MKIDPILIKKEMLYPKINKETYSNKKEELYDLKIKYNEIKNDKKKI